MHSSSMRLIATFWLVGVALSAPLGIEYDKTAGLATAEQDNKARLDKATTDANAQIAKMRQGFEKYKTGDKKATELFETSFGKNADKNEVEKNIAALETNNIKAKLETQTFKKDEIASVPWKKKRKTTLILLLNLAGGGKDPLDDSGRAGTIIHEATHQLMKTGDDINKSGKVIKANDGSSKKSGNTGYTSNHNMHKTVADVKKDTGFSDVRDNTKNMHHNAESYALFASLCSQPGALRRRDLYIRALMEGDDEELYYLARDDNCKLPPDYFARKDAAAKAAAGQPSAGNVAASHDPKTAAAVHSPKEASTAHGYKEASPVHDAKTVHPNEKKVRNSHPASGGTKPAAGTHVEHKQPVHGGPQPHVNSHKTSPKMVKLRRR
ncbi:hypothetical protein BDN70DRAFT_928486 [Pholiota conissans]|uniref:Lysine-specific metallo-endopeptidase domain-containing protein n=1 Tax=Pholiota conissans TaxID=109636 RepID=A0A9P6CYM3_9AGAR|nr:hypothetical protein BDN70DRAFT_928486 [Pholiota conissans]